jgi:succinoglycan biosynthesis protein ExoO
MSIDHPDVSFIIAAYNVQDTLKRAIDSALAQVGVTVEVVVVDDCSTDGTREIAAAYSDPRVRLICQPENGGPGKARNAGIAAAKGRWVATLDSDDAVYPERLLSMLQRAAALEAQVVVDNMDVVPLEGGQGQTMFAREQLVRQGEITLAEFIASNVIFQSSFNFGYMKPIFERSFLLQHDLGFDETLKIGEDYILFASALACGARCAVDPNAGYVYYLRHGSISRVLKHHHLDDMLLSDRRFLSRYTLSDEEMEAQRRRTHSILEARTFLTMVDEIKRKSLGGFLRTAINNPRALRHLKMPVTVRLRRLARAAGGRKFARAG